jgi:fatty-acyl-CoA synthase
MQPSYTHGITPTPLLGDTVGDNLRETVERFGDREALVSRHQKYRATYKQLWAEIVIVARGLIARGIKKGRPGRAVGAQPLRMDGHAVRLCTSGRHHGQHQSAFRTHELVHKQSGTSLLVMTRGFRQTNHTSPPAREFHLWQ